MKDNEVQQLVDIRSYLINKYNNLDGRSNAGTAVILQKDVAYIIEHTISKIDEILGEYVKIKKK
jgi:hypothetical protein